MRLILSIDARAGSIDLEGEKKVRLLGRVYLTGTYADVVAATKRCAPFAEIFAYADGSTAAQGIALLNYGASRVGFERSQVEEFAEIPPERRFIVTGNLNNLSLAESYLYQGSIPATKYEGQGEVMMAATDINSVDECLTLGFTGIIPESCLSLGNSAGQVSLADLITRQLVSDRPDGLFTTVVVNEQDIALGLAYSSAESIAESIRTGTGVYQSRNRGLWYKGATSGATQKLLNIDMDCDSDCLRYRVQQAGSGYCHLNTFTCFGNLKGWAALERTLLERKASSPQGSYTKRLFDDPALLKAKIMEEAGELCDAVDKDHIAFEAADLLYFALTKCVAAGVSLADIDASLDIKAKRITRRKGDAKFPLANNPTAPPTSNGTTAEFRMKVFNYNQLSERELQVELVRPIQKTSEIMPLVEPIVMAVKTKGDTALLEFTAKFEKAELKSPIIPSPFPSHLMQIPESTARAIDTAFANIYKFHSAQIAKDATLSVETMEGVVCSRFSRPIEKVGLYVPGGTAVLPSTAMMLGVPALVAGCQTIVLATPPRQDGTVSPEIVYIANKIRAKQIVLAGGAQAVAAMAYGTESVPKCDKIFGPGNQFVTAAKMMIQNDMTSLTSIDLPAGPSEVLIIADGTANPDFVASDLLSQSEHGADSMSVLVALNLTPSQLEAIESAVERLAKRLPRADILRQSLANGKTICVDTVDQACKVSNLYAPEHLILYFEGAAASLPQIINAGSVFVGPWSPVACGDYASGTNRMSCELWFMQLTCQIPYRHTALVECTRASVLHLFKSSLRAKSCPRKGCAT